MIETIINDQFKLFVPPSLLTLKRKGCLRTCVEAQEKAAKTAWDLMQDADLNATQTQRKNNTDNLDSQQGCIDREGYRSCF